MKLILGLLLLTSFSGFAQQYNEEQSIEFNTSGNYLDCVDSISLFRVYGIEDKNISIHEGSLGDQDQILMPYVVSDIKSQSGKVSFDAKKALSFNDSDPVLSISIDLKANIMTMVSSSSGKSYKLTCEEGLDK